MENKLFRYALITSILLHINLFVIVYFSNSRLHKKPFKSIQISYVSTRETDHAEKFFPRAVRSIGEKKLSPKTEILDKSTSLPSSLLKELTKPLEKMKSEKLHSKMKIVEKRRDVSIPYFKAEKINNPKYLNYTQKIREKIRRRAYAQVSDPDFETGEVYLSFVLLSNGVLKEVKVVESKTTATANLRQIGLKSIKESNPFPVFPEDLTYPELPFNVVISFEVSDQE